MTHETGVLIAAILDGHVELARRKLAEIEDKNAMLTEMWNALHMAIEDGNPDMVKAIVDSGADVEFPCNTLSPLTHAIDLEGDAAHQQGDVEPDCRMTQILLDAGADPAARDQDGRLPIELARRYRHRRAIELLLARGKGAKRKNGSR